MRYLMIIKHTEDYANKTPPSGMYKAMGEFVGKAFADGKMIDAGGLKPTGFGRRVRMAHQALSVIDGPFVESKEIIGGYALMEMASEAEALEYGRRFMEIHLEYWPTFEGECEIRPLQDA